MQKQQVLNFNAEVTVQALHCNTEAAGAKL
jgi:hypothetical protein